MKAHLLNHTSVQLIGGMFLVILFSLAMIFGAAYLEDQGLMGQLSGVVCTPDESGAC